eukprot:scaffold384959_cov21-Prasinocladus_malaysianus.AAC.1
MTDLLSAPAILSARTTQAVLNGFKLDSSWPWLCKQDTRITIASDCRLLWSLRLETTRSCALVLLECSYRVNSQT